MAVLAFAQCALAAASGRHFIVENPTNSWIWELAEAKALAGMEGVRVVLLHNCAFGGDRRKATTLLTNMAEVEEECGRVCGETRAKASCPFLGRPHTQWDPKVDAKGNFAVPSKDEAEYTPPRCARPSRRPECGGRRRWRSRARRSFPRSSSRSSRGRRPR